MAEGLCVSGTTSYPIYLKDKEVVFNLRRVPRNAIDKMVLAQFPTSLATIRLKDPREGAPRTLKHQRAPRD